MSESEKKQTAVERAWAVRRARLRRIIRNFAVLVGGPTLLAILYYGIWAADEYVSETVVAVQSPPAGQDELGGSFVSNREDDARLVRTTLQSRAALDALIATAGWREHYASGGNLFSSLDKDGGSEEAFSYYSDRVQIRAPKNQAVKLSVRAFSPEAAEKFSRALLAIADKQLNEVSLRPLAEQIKVAAGRLAEAKERLAAIPAPAGPESVEAPAHAAAQEAVVHAEQLAAKLEMARVARTRYLTVISGPSVPTEAAYPKRIWSILTVFVVSFSLMGIFSLLLGAVREHAKV